MNNKYIIVAILLMSVKVVFGQSVRYEKIVTYRTRVTWDTPPPRI